jgi:ABC-2 type transport system ATP-binding protein
VGALIEGPGFYPYLSGRENLRVLARYRGLPDPAVDAALDRVDLLDRGGDRFKAYSLGMKQRLGVAAALMGDPDLLVLDEPTNGLDPQGTREVRHLVSELAADGTTVLVSSHLLSEVEQMCDHVGVMYAGRLVAQQPLADLHTGTATTVRVRTTASATDKTLTTLAGLGLTGGQHQSAGGDRATVTAALGAVELDRVVPALVAADVPVLGFEVVAPSLEDVFVSLTGEGFEVSG